MVILILDRCSITYLLPLLYIFFIRWLYYICYWLLNDRDLGCFQGFFFYCCCLFFYYYIYYYQEPYGRDMERHNPDPLPKRGSLPHLLRELPLHNLHSGFTFRKSHQLHPRLSSLPGTTHNQWLDECINTWPTVEATQLRRSPWTQGCQAPITAWDLSLVFLFQDLIPRACLVNNLHIELCQH